MTIEKYYSICDLQIILRDIKRGNSIIGFANGCFDLLHLGHLYLLKEASAMCDYLIVAVNSDSSIKSLKGEGRPIETELTRIMNLSLIQDVDDLVMFKDDTPLELITRIEPNILFKGSDYKEKDVVGSEIVKKNGGKVVLIHTLEGYSTTNIINKSSI